MNPLPDANIIQQLFDAYNNATGFAVLFNAVWERNLYECARMGLTAEMVALVIKDRQKGIKTGERKPASLMPRNLFIGDDVINETICEACALLALKRKVVDVPRASILKSTNRPADYVGISGQQEQRPTQDTAKPAADVVEKLLTEFRRAAG